MDVESGEQLDDVETLDSKHDTKSTKEPTKTSDKSDQGRAKDSRDDQRGSRGGDNDREARYSGSRTERQTGDRDYSRETYNKSDRGREFWYAGLDRRRNESFTHPRSSKPSIKIDHEETCPLLLRAFLTKEKLHDPHEFDSGRVPDNEFQLHAWRDLSMHQFAELIRIKHPEARRKEFRFAVIYAEPRSGSWKLRDVGAVNFKHPGSVDRTTLHDLGFMAGDYFSVALVNPEPPPAHSHVRSDIRTGGPERHSDVRERERERGRAGHGRNDRRDHSDRHGRAAEREDYYRHNSSIGASQGASRWGDRDRDSRGDSRRGAEPHDSRDNRERRSEYSSRLAERERERDRRW